MIEVRRGGAPRAGSGVPVLHFAAAPGTGFGITVSAAGAGALRGAGLQARGALGAGLPTPNATVVATGRLDGGLPGLLDADGALAATAEGAVISCLDPEDPASTWHEEPSFAVFVAAALEHLVGRERLEFVSGVPESEISVATTAVPLPTPDQVRALERRADGRSLAPGLAVLAACCALGAVLAGRPRSFRVPSWGPDRAR